MGGTLSNKRLGRDEFFLYLEELRPMLGKILDGIDHRSIPFYYKKKDFGDVDFVVKADAGLIIPKVKEYFNPDNMFVNDGIISFTYKDFQVDLICTVKDYDTTLNYMAYNDLGNLLGRIFHKMGLKLGHEGLLYPLRDLRDGIREEVVVSKDMDDILKFLGCDHTKWNFGFDTMGELFEFVATSSFFDRRIYDGELSPINKKRDAKRKTFNFFLAWLEITQPHSKYSFGPRDTRSGFVTMIDHFFGSNIETRKMLLDVALEREELFKKKFSGDLLMRLIPVSGQELGKFLSLYKRHLLGITQDKSIDKTDNLAFEEDILGMDQTIINNSIVNFYSKVTGVRTYDDGNEFNNIQ